MAIQLPPQLTDITADLAAQEAALTKELTELAAKREALRSVIQLFDPSEAPAPQTPVTKQTTKKKATAKKTTPKKTTSAKKVTAKKTATRKTTTTTKPAAAKKTKAKATRQKKDGRAASWQKYARPDMRKQPMPEAVRLILTTQPEKDFKIAEVMAALFKDDMPKAQFLKARNRISNILSGGVRNGDWYKGDRGAYRLTPKTT